MPANAKCNLDIDKPAKFLYFDMRIQETKDVAKVLWFGFVCAGFGRGICILPIHPNKDRGNPSWTWDKNFVCPTLKGSVDCRKVCGWHGRITNGECVDC